jgi:single-stranded DNA-binding protein
MRWCPAHAALRRSVNVEEIVQVSNVVMPCFLVELGGRKRHIDAEFSADPCDPTVRFGLSAGPRGQVLTERHPVGNFSLATNERFKDRNNEWQDRTEWHNVVARQRPAEIVGEHVAKGSKLYIEGKFRPEAGKTGRAGKRSTALKSSPATYCCSATGKRRRPASSDSERESGPTFPGWLFVPTNRCSLRLVQQTPRSPDSYLRERRPRPQLLW